MRSTITMAGLALVLGTSGAHAKQGIDAQGSFPPDDLEIAEGPDGEPFEPRPDSDDDPETSVTPPATPPSVLAILAHPDDEITIAPVLSRMARNGGNVTVVFATSGDAGPGSSGLEPGAKLAELREGEARCAAFALGLPEPMFWRLPDGTLGTMARVPDSSARQAMALISQAIADVKPRVIMTWGPDGGYGHADHRMISAAVTQVVQSMNEDRPDLIYSAIPRGQRPDLPEFEEWATTEPSLITDRIGYEAMDLEASRGALDCYESQFPQQVRAGLIDLLHSSVWRGTVHFRLAFASPF